MIPVKTTIERLELKYLVDESIADRIRHQIAPYCTLDQHATKGHARSPRSYVVQSLYLDTPSLAFHRAKERGYPSRFKLRIRGYRDGKAALELKQRYRDTVSKTRAFVPAEDIRDAAYGLAKEFDDRPENARFLDEFARRVHSSGAEPTLLVGYDREAYASDVDAYARVTLDRNVMFQRVNSWTLDGDERAWTRLDEHVEPETPRPPVVLELKCERAVPFWLLEVVRTHELRRQSTSKYSLGIYLTRRLEGRRDVGIRARGFLR